MPGRLYHSLRRRQQSFSRLRFSDARIDLHHLFHAPIDYGRSFSVFSSLLFFELPSFALFIHDSAGHVYLV